jgi:amino acid transporter
MLSSTSSVTHCGLTCCKCSTVAVLPVKCSAYLQLTHWFMIPAMCMSKLNFSGFSQAFKARGLYWAYEVTAVGEIVTLPLVVLVSFIAQPRLQYALAEDGLLPAMFGQVSAYKLYIHVHVKCVYCTATRCSSVTWRCLAERLSACLLTALTRDSLICMI